MPKQRHEGPLPDLGRGIERLERLVPAVVITMVVVLVVVSLWAALVNLG